MKEYPTIKYVHGAGGPQFVNAETGELVSPREVVERYNRLREAEKVAASTVERLIAIYWRARRKAEKMEGKYYRPKAALDVVLANPQMPTAGEIAGDRPLDRALAEGGAK